VPEPEPEPTPEPEPELSGGVYTIIFVTDKKYDDPVALNGANIGDTNVWIRLNIDQVPSLSIDRVEWFLDDVLYRDDDLKAPYDLTYMPKALRFSDWGSPGEHTVTAMVVYSTGLQEAVKATVTVTDSSPPLPEPEPEPEPTPEPEPVPGIFPNASNTGVPAGTRLTRVASSSWWVVPGGTVLDSIEFTGTIVIGGPNVTIRRSRIICDNSNAGINNFVSNYANVVVEDSEVACIAQPVVSSASIAGSNITIKRCNLWGGADGVKLGSNSKLLDSYIHDLRDGITPSGGTSHNDGVQISSGSDIDILRNTITNEGGTYVNAGVFVKPDFGPISNVVIDGNYLDDFGFTARLSGATVTDSRITNNVFGYGFLYGTVLVDRGAENPANNNVVSGNQYDDGISINY